VTKTIDSRSLYFSPLRLSFRLDLAIGGLEKAATQRQAVSKARVGTEHLFDHITVAAGTNLDECRSNAVDYS